MERARVTYTAEEIRNGVLKEIVPAPGANKIIVPMYLVRRWTNPAGTLFSNNVLRLAFNTCYQSSGTSIQVIPSAEISRYARTQYFTNTLVSVDGSNNQLTPINAPITMIPAAGITGGSDEIVFDLFYVIDDLS
jgi:hypothetical protein